MGDAILVYPDPPPALLVQTLDLAGYPWKAATNVSVAMQLEPADGWAGAVISAETDPEGAFVLCRAARSTEAMEAAGRTAVAAVRAALEAA